jgi:KR domain
VIDPDGATALVQRAVEEFGPLHTVVHAAMVLRDRTLAN